MCQSCDRPEATDDRFSVQAVSGSRSVAELSYTVGLTEHGVPELLVTGLRPDLAADMLVSWGSYLLDQEQVLAGETMGWGRFVMEAVQVDRPQEHLLLAHARYGDALRALQLVWADRDGRWPWDHGFQSRQAGQPVLGTPAPWYCPEHAPDRWDVPPHLP